MEVLAPPYHLSFVPRAFEREIGREGDTVAEDGLIVVSLTYSFLYIAFFSLFLWLIDSLLAFECVVGLGWEWLDGWVGFLI